MELETSIAFTLATTVGLTQALKVVAERIIGGELKIGRFNLTPAIPLVIGIVVVSLLLPVAQTRELILYGLIAGLSSMGLYSGTKSLLNV